MVLEVLKFPDSRLRQESKPVESVTGELRDFVKNMFDTMYNLGGIGLSAIQVNRPIRLLILDTRIRKEVSERYENIEQLSMTQLEKNISQPLTLFNPEILSQKGETTFNEGCLSIPGYYEEVIRSSHIKVKGLDINEQEVLLDVDGLMSICIQHEIDHLNGKLFIDKLSPIKALRIKSKIKKIGYPSIEKKEQVQI